MVPVAHFIDHGLKTADPFSILITLQGDLVSLRFEAFQLCL